MSVPAKKLRIEDIKDALKKEGVTGSKIEAVVRRLKSVSSKVDDTVSVDELFEEIFSNESRPAVLLKGARYKGGLTQEELAKKIKTNQAAIAAMESGRRPIGKNMAQRLSKALGVDYRLFL